MTRYKVLCVHALEQNSGFQVAWDYSKFIIAIWQPASIQRLRVERAASVSMVNEQ